MSNVRLLRARNAWVTSAPKRGRPKPLVPVRRSQGSVGTRTRNQLLEVHAKEKGKIRNMHVKRNKRFSTMRLLTWP